MEYRILGRTGVQVSKLCLGAMMFGPWGDPDHDNGIRTIHRALDAGINFIDTADVYSQGESEEILAKALAGGRRDDIVLATKFHGAMGEDPNQQGSSRRWIIREVENSLRRLNTDWIDLYQVHRPRTDTDIEETLSALTDLVHQGKVRYIGSSTFPASQQWVAAARADCGGGKIRCRVHLGGWRGRHGGLRIGCVRRGGHRCVCGACEPVSQHGAEGLHGEPWIVALSTSVRLTFLLALPASNVSTSAPGKGS
jgi:aryl-alcohol dehydrogenase-like predicted oxidoreductase